MGRLYELIRVATRRALLDATEGGSLDELARSAGEGAGDVTYGLDLPAEEVLSRWLEEEARSAPLSLLTEDAGWRHMGPGPTGAVELPDFDHGGPRVVADPVDGTRCLMADMRSAWTVLAWAPPGPDAPHQSDVQAGLLGELPESRSSQARVFTARRGSGCSMALVELESGQALSSNELRVDDDGRVDRGFFPFFSYDPAQRLELAHIQARFFERLRVQEGAHLRDCFDDQYISNGGQLALLSLGTYRMIADLRAHLSASSCAAAPTSKPYDVSGALVCAEAAGCVVRGPRGEELDFPLDAQTPVAWVGYANEATRARLEPHLLAALDTPSEPQQP